MFLFPQAIRFIALSVRYELFQAQHTLTDTNYSGMKLLSNWFLLITFFLLSQYIVAQKSGVRGTVFDKGTGDPMIGAVVFLQGTDYASVSNIDGDYNISGVPYGDYVLKLTYIGYDSISVNIKIGKKMINQNLQNSY